VEFKDVRATNIHDGIYEELAKAIISGRILPGTRITLEAIAAKFSVSIMPVREAFRRLEAMKLVMRQRNRSIVVSELSDENVDEILKVRLLLETYAAETAASIRSQDTIQLLDTLNDQMEAATDVDLFLAKNRDFHFTLYKAANIPLLVEIISPLWERYSPYLYMLHRDQKRRPMAMVMRNHRGMAEAVRKKDKKTVAYWLGRDLVESAERVVSMIRERRSDAGN
jgi:DNA-binding GntR family transcriptional regulator